MEEVTRFFESFEGLIDIYVSVAEVDQVFDLVEAVIDGFVCKKESLLQTVFAQSFLDLLQVLVGFEPHVHADLSGLFGEETPIHG